MPFQKGMKRPPGAGRKPNQKNKRTIAIEAAKAEAYDLLKDEMPLTTLRDIASNNLPCGRCRGKLKTRYGLPVAQHKLCECVDKKPKADEDCPICVGTGWKTWGWRVCESCWADGMEHCSPKDRGWASDVLLRKQLPDLNRVDAKVDHSGKLDHRIEVVFK